MVNKGNGLVDGVKPVKRGTPEMAQLVEGGYAMSVEEAEKILADWEKNPQTWPLDMVQKARGCIAAFTTDPVVVSEKPGWKRDKSRR